MINIFINPEASNASISNGFLKIDIFLWKLTNNEYIYKSWGEQRLHFERIFENWLFCIKTDKLQDFVYFFDPLEPGLS